MKRGKKVVPVPWGTKVPEKGDVFVLSREIGVESTPVNEKRWKNREKVKRIRPFKVIKIIDIKEDYYECTGYKVLGPGAEKKKSKEKFSFRVRFKNNDPVALTEKTFFFK
ncbi:hypothetical protein KKA39_00210 [Patescibacteria group bacterium]|nr:hypothetical protein [Patescibacteria group bacterium]MBU1727733.1 hypothetical protein [Patescibacteria group bacterium]